MIIGIPKEILAGENRVAATPETVQNFVKIGFEVIVESMAGTGIFQPDEAYKTAGATIIKGADKLLAKSDIILKVKQPHFNQDMKKHEVEMLREGSILVAFLHPAAPENHKIVRLLGERNITSLTMDGIPRISRAQKMDALTSMSTVTGYKSVLIAANHLPKFVPMIGTVTGVIKPANFLIIGAGIVGLQAIATAKRLGGVVKAIDIRDDARREAASLGAKVLGFEVPPELAIGKGGYAKALPKEWLTKERETITSLLDDIDVIILCALIPGELAPMLITEEMVTRLKPGSVIIDVSIDQGGNCASTEPGKEVNKTGVTIYGLQNIPGSMPIDSTRLYASNIYYYVENMYKKGIGTLDLDDEIVKNSLVTYQGKIVHEGTLKAMGLS